MWEISGRWEDSKSHSVDANRKVVGPHKENLRNTWKWEIFPIHRSYQKGKLHISQEFQIKWLLETMQSKKRKRKGKRKKKEKEKEKEKQKQKTKHKTKQNKNTKPKTIVAKTNQLPPKTTKIIKPPCNKIHGYFGIW